MAGINNLLFSVQNMSPAMLSVGVGKTQNYNNLAELSSLWNGTDSGTSGLTGNSATDTVSLTYKTVGQKVVTDMASVTAKVIKEYPELDNDYVIALVDTDSGREARVYRRSDILANFEGTDEEKKALEKELAKNPLMVFSNANGLPETSSDAASKKLASELNTFLSSSAKTLDLLDKAGYDPLADMLGSSTMKKILANYAHQATAAAAEEDEE